VTLEQRGCPPSLVHFPTAATPHHTTHPQRSTRVACHCPVMVFSRHAGRRSLFGNITTVRPEHPGDEGKGTRRSCLCAGVAYPRETARIVSLGDLARGRTAGREIVGARAPGPS